MNTQQPEPRTVTQADINEILSRQYQEYRAQPLPDPRMRKLKYVEYLELYAFKQGQELAVKSFVLSHLNELLALMPLPEGQKDSIPAAMEWVKAQLENQP